MKNLLIICLLSTISSVFGQVKSPCGNIRKKSEPRRYLNCYDQVSYDEEINTYVLTKDGFTPFNGTCQTWNRSGYVLEELTCTNGKRDGIDTSFYGSGCVQSTQGYILGIKNGKHQVFFDSTGQLRKEENYLNGKLNGLVQEFNRSGDTLIYMNYAQDIPHGVQRTYYPDGKRFKVISYKNGLLDGSHLTYTEEGKLELKLSYKEGKKDGVFIFYHENEKEAGKETWSLDLKNGEFITYNEEGKILKQGTYKKNVAIGEHNVFDVKGKLVHQTIYDKKGIKTYEMEVDEYGDQKVLYSASGPAKPSGIEEDDDPKNIEPANDKKNKRKKRKERRKKE
jgi:antitoxin component YwqK of YwqJK toxin-antitoxin module